MQQECMFKYCRRFKTRSVHMCYSTITAQLAFSKELRPVELRPHLFFLPGGVSLCPRALLPFQRYPTGKQHRRTKAPAGWSEWCGCEGGRPGAC